MKLHQAVLIYPHQIFQNNSLLDKSKIIILIEEPLFFSQYKFHKQKLILHRASLKAYETELLQADYTVHYVECHQVKNTEDIIKILKQHKISEVDFYDPVDDWLETKLVRGLNAAKIKYTSHETPMFLTDKESLKSFFLTQKGKNTYSQKNFYQWQRQRLNILIEASGKPVGGVWSFDRENRQKLPRNISLPASPKANDNHFVFEAKSYVQKYFPGNYGSDDKFIYPISHTESKAWLNDFLNYKLNLFGPYEDAISQEHHEVFHSLLSPLLNIGLLTPKIVIETTLKYFKAHPKTSLASLEGFIRQIIGWREYMRAIYYLEGRNIRRQNYFKANLDLPSAFWTGETGLEIIDVEIKKVLATGYSHHIIRLMVFGNFMNLCGIKPNDVYQWFMTIYIDAYDWVMVPNVYSMALYADGGLITTKPYISGSNYLLKMSDYRSGEWSKIWDALFWSFIGQHEKKLASNGRLGFIGVQYKKMSSEKKQNFRQIAQDFLKTLS